MNKSDIATDIHRKFPGLTKAAATDMVDTVLALITNDLRTGRAVSLHGFGNFAVKQKAERDGVNPKTKAKIRIAAKRVVQFKPSASLLG